MVVGGRRPRSPLWRCARGHGHASRSGRACSSAPWRWRAASPRTPTPAQVFSALSWKGSLVFAADSQQRATGVAFQASGGTQVAVATEAEGELVYPLTVITGGDYRVRARLAGAPDRPAVVEFVPAGPGRPRRHRGAGAVLDHGMGRRRRAPPRPWRLLGGGAASRRRVAGDDRGGAALRLRRRAAARMVRGRRRGRRWTWRSRWSRPSTRSPSCLRPRRPSRSPRNRSRRRPRRRPRAAARGRLHRPAGGRPLHHLRLRARGRRPGLERGRLPQGDRVPAPRSRGAARRSGAR